MTFALLIAAMVVVITLVIINGQQSRTITNYEQELTKKARKGRKNATK